MARSAILDLRAPLADLKHQPASWAAFLSMRTGLGYWACFVGAAYADEPWLRLSLSALLGPFIALSFRMGHDCGHGAHFPGPRLNQLFGVLSHLPAYHPFGVWIASHNLSHHAFTNLKTRDYIWIPLSKAEYDRLGPFGRLMQRLYRTTLGAGFYYLYEIWWRQMLVGRPQVRRKLGRAYWRDLAVVLGFFALQLGVLAADGPGAETFTLRVLLAIVLPFCVFNWMVGFVSFLNHTHPDVPWFQDRDAWSFYAGQVNCTVHMRVPPWLIFFITDLGLHGAHHIDPQVPVGTLDEAETDILLRSDEHIVRESWNPSLQADIMRRCKLYDYDRRRWLDFDGRPTGPSLATS